MPSTILYDKRSGRIVESAPKPYGSAPMPSRKGLLMSALIPECEEEYYETLVIEGDYLTYQAKSQLRVVPKPRVMLDCDALSLVTGEQTQITVSITNHLTTESFDVIEIYVNDAALSIPLANNTATFPLQFTETGHYRVTCKDKRFTVDDLVLEVV